MSIEAMKQALEALNTVEWHGGGSCWIVDGEAVDEAVEALRQAIAEAEKQEPVAFKKDAVFAASIEFIGTLTGMKPPPIEVAPPEVFQPFKDFTEKVCAIFADTHPQPKREPLTDEEFISMIDSDGIRIDPVLAFEIKEIVETAHGIKEENT